MNEIQSLIARQESLLNEVSQVRRQIVNIVAMKYGEMVAKRLSAMKIRLGEPDPFCGLPSLVRHAIDNAGISTVDALRESMASYKVLRWRNFGFKSALITCWWLGMETPDWLVSMVDSKKKQLIKELEKIEAT